MFKYRFIFTMAKCLTHIFLAHIAYFQVANLKK
uniref:Uncharacterized protein n=1 Tax=Anguilla anguilla TaxID=7936 RepID=A0A0E9V6U2_ANGAN